ncbi:MAG: sulfurtransferase [Myxococcota bacterium]|nr:sulfurtransferase [Myxococcota bacterium]
MIVDRIPDGALVFDCRHKTHQPGAGYRAFEAGHLPGAQHLNLDTQLSAPVRPDGIGGRHPLPEPAVFGALMRRCGLSAGRLVVGYDDIGGAYAARLWWLLRWLGHDNVAVLSGGLSAVEVPLESGPAAPTVAGSWLPRVCSERVATRSEAARVGLLVDARAPGRFRGEHEILDPIAGHIPGAINRPWTDSLVGGRLTTTPDIPRGPGVVYCGSGVTACVTLLLLDAAGRDDLRLYPGSWSDWLAGGGPVATGP